MIPPGGERHQIVLFFQKPVVAAIRPILQVCVVQFVNQRPQIRIKAFEAEVTVFFQFVEQAFFEDANCVLYGAFIFWLPNLGRKDHGVIVFRPLGIVFVQFRLDPVPIRDDGLLTVIADDQWRNTLKETERMIVHLDPLRLLSREHSFRINVL